MATSQGIDPDSARKKVVRYLQSAHAMEQQSLDALQTVIRTAGDEELRQLAEHHLDETRGHTERLEHRLEGLGEKTSTMKDTQNKLMAALSDSMAGMRPDKDGKLVRDSYITEHMEIAFYEMLERVARKAGDEESATLASEICANEKQTADKIASKWDHFADVALHETAMG